MEEFLKVHSLTAEIRSRSGPVRSRETLLAEATARLASALQELMTAQTPGSPSQAQVARMLEAFGALSDNYQGEADDMLYRFDDLVSAETTLTYHARASIKDEIVKVWANNV
jgi:hypothetical protein